MNNSLTDEMFPKKADIDALFPKPPDKGKGGAPKGNKNAHQGKNRSVRTFYANDAEHQELKRLAVAKKMSITGFILKKCGVKIT